MSHPIGKPTICINENKGADQLRIICEADQRLCFRYSDSTFPLLLKSEISSFNLFSVLVQVGLYRTSSDTTLLVFPPGSSNVNYTFAVYCKKPLNKSMLVFFFVFFNSVIFKSLQQSIFSQINDEKLASCTLTVLNLTAEIRISKDQELIVSVR